MESFGSASRDKIVNAVENFMETLDKTHVRNVERDLHLCAAQCCKDMTGTKESVQRCVMQCARPMEMVNSKLQNEMEHIQDRLNRCFQSCNDKVREDVGTNPTSDLDLAKRDSLMKKGIENCTEEVLALLPKTLKACQEFIKLNVKTA